MKEVTNMSRLVNQLEKMFRALNTDLFDGVLDMPVITVVPSSRSWAHYTPWSSWITKDDFRREVNIASGGLYRPLEAIAASLLHEMVHMYNDTVLDINDTSRNGTYHNKAFAKACADHGLICNRTEKYGWAHTEAGDRLLEWLLNHDEFREIEMCRIDPSTSVFKTGTHNSGDKTTSTTPVKGNSRRYFCPCCHTIIRATKAVNVVCGDCMVKMIEG